MSFHRSTSSRLVARLLLVVGGGLSAGAGCGDTEEGGAAGAAQGGAGTGGAGQGGAGAGAGKGGTAGAGAAGAGAAGAGAAGAGAGGAGAGGAGAGGAGAGGAGSGGAAAGASGAGAGGMPSSLPEPDATWTPECSREVPPMMPIGACCIDLACYAPAAGEACLPFNEAATQGKIVLTVGVGSGTCGCGENGGKGGPYTVPEGYPTGKGPKPGDCCYTSNYAYCEGRPLVIDAEKRAARLSGDPSWG